MKKIILLAGAASLLSACGVAGKLDHLGKPPTMSKVQEITAPDFEPTLADRGSDGRMPRGQSHEAEQQSASLYRAGGSGLFADQRARRLGDIVTVKINIADKANIGDTTTRTRQSAENVGIANLLGLEKVVPKAVNPASLVGGKSDSSSVGNGTTQRSEQINMIMAAIVTKVLPNGNLLIQGKQEIRVNFELREFVLTGIIRPQDIAADNSILHSQIAEARVSYGGRGQLTDVQQARYGQQIFDALFPF